MRFLSKFQTQDVERFFRLIVKGDDLERKFNMETPAELFEQASTKGNTR